MDDFLIKKERIDAIERIERQLVHLRGKRQSLRHDLSEAQQDVLRPTKTRGLPAERWRKLQDAVAADTQNTNEINQLVRQLDRARETFERDYPRFGRGD